MSNYDTTEIENAIEERCYGWGELAWRNNGHKETVILRDESVEIELIDSEAGGEGSGSDIWAVVKVGDQLFRKQGYYASHYGSDWDGDVTEVKPVEKTITVYERI